TSPYKFYQFWLNVSDEDAARYIKIFTFLSKEEIDDLIAQQAADPGLRPLQRRLAKEVTCMVHSEADYEAAVEASQILFSKNAAETLQHIDEQTLLDVFEGVPRFDVALDDINAGIGLADLLTEKAPVFPSKGELRKLAQGGGFSINREKVADVYAPASPAMLLNGKYILVQKGKKNYFLLTAK
ncbi:MAG: tyrosine--tRNA ligase, partial [Muribaculaceae bacterium]|nr:tyrosine--tRNA ligase [Muribaculaceae bacterium]